MERLICATSAVFINHKMAGNFKQPGSGIHDGTEFSLLPYCPEEDLLYQIIGISLITRLSE
jgi:hypothetical protein